MRASEILFGDDLSGIYVNNLREGDFQRAITTANLLFGKHLLLRKGKRTYTVITAK